MTAVCKSIRRSHCPFKLPLITKRKEKTKGGGGKKQWLRYRENQISTGFLVPSENEAAQRWQRRARPGRLQPAAAVRSSGATRWSTGASSRHGTRVVTRRRAVEEQPSSSVRPRAPRIPKPSENAPFSRCTSAGRRGLAEMQRNGQTCRAPRRDRTNAPPNHTQPWQKAAARGGHRRA